MKTTLTACLLFLLAHAPAAAALTSVQTPAATPPPARRPSTAHAPPKPLEEQPFLLAVEDVFAIAGRGTVATGRVERGRLKVGDAVEIVGVRATRQTVVTGIEAPRKLLEVAGPGDAVALLLRGVERMDVSRGQVIAAPGSVKPRTKFKASFDLLTTEAGGRRTPLRDGYRPQFYFRTSEFTGTLKLAAGREAAAPGDMAVEAEVELSAPLALEEGLRFSIREGGREVGVGVVLKLIE